MPRQRKLPPGLVRRGGRYYLDFWHGTYGSRQRFRRSAGTDLDEAIRQLLRWRRYLADGPGTNAPSNDFPIAELRKQYEAWLEQHRPRTHRHYRADLDKVLGAMTVKLVSEITPARVLAYRKHRLAEVKACVRHTTDAEGHPRPLPTVSPRTVNKEVATLGRLLNWAVSQGIIGSNPIRGLPELPHDSPRKVRRALTVNEVRALLTASKPHWRPIWRCFLATGMRVGEVCGLRWADVDFEDRSLTVRAAVSKTHKDRIVPLDDALLADLRRLRRRRGRGPHVFTSMTGTPLGKRNLLTRFYESCRRAGIEPHGERGDVDMHSLRVTFVTLALQHGANPKDVQEIVGHSTLDMTMQVYAKATDAGRRAAINALPYATANGPAHLISVQSGQETVRGSGEETQPVDSKDVG